ncbi:hypothetical protein V8C86DRAFT_2909374, partial [Haematococcus lacustris]
MPLQPSDSAALLHQPGTGAGRRGSLAAQCAAKPSASSSEGPPPPLAAVPPSPAIPPATPAPHAGPPPVNAAPSRVSPAQATQSWTADQQADRTEHPLPPPTPLAPPPASPQAAWAPGQTVLAPGLSPDPSGTTPGTPLLAPRLPSLPSEIQPQPPQAPSRPPAPDSPPTQVLAVPPAPLPSAVPDPASHPSAAPSPAPPTLANVRPAPSPHRLRLGVAAGPGQRVWRTASCDPADLRAHLARPLPAPPDGAAPGLVAPPLVTSHPTSHAAPGQLPITAALQAPLAAALLCPAPLTSAGAVPSLLQNHPSSLPSSPLPIGSPSSSSLRAKAPQPSAHSPGRAKHSLDAPYKRQQSSSGARAIAWGPASYPDARIPDPT